MAYQELIKNFEKVRAYLREFYVYGFKSRTEYDKKSARSYDDERRRVESWLGEYMGFTQTPEGKNVFLSVDSRVTKTNPFYKAWKAKSFTDGDITLHFAIFDVLYDPSIQKTLNELIEDIDERLDSALAFDESTLRKKLKEYESEGIIRIEKEGRKVLYSRAPQIDISQLTDAVDFFSEAAPCGVIGSFLQERLPEHEERFAFKHHYITQAMDSAVMETLFEAIRLRRYVTIDNLGKRAGEIKTVRLVPLKIYISAQNGRQNLIAFHERGNRIGSYRLDYITKVKIEEPCEEFERFREILKRAESHMWGVNCKWNPNQTEHVEFEIRVGENEQFIVQRLEREKRCGRLERVDETHYRYVAEVYDTMEMIPWIRTFLSRITQMTFSNRTAENQFKADIEDMYRMYGIEGGDSDVV
ncbi:MAG: WYL domain-containing protein [Firmicutes bacterium]|nr:WYL domain-containing protein [Bacillota bacterium]